MVSRLFFLCWCWCRYFWNWVNWNVMLRMVSFWLKLVILVWWICVLSVNCCLLLGMCWIVIMWWCWKYCLNRVWCVGVCWWSFFVIGWWICLISVMSWGFVISLKWKFWVMVICCWFILFVVLLCVWKIVWKMSVKFVVLSIWMGVMCCCRKINKCLYLMVFRLWVVMFIILVMSWYLCRVWLMWFVCYCRVLIFLWCLMFFVLMKMVLCYCCWW